ncbi:hypothetical protein SAMN05421770_102577 [Granulicella rosea]|uniref:Uncharacterized protein n=2 Tax=Granulicella rosea TaxID=474952 RepID=A0A239HUU5_9BACT|nr:hypothetical protein SAMN05421770_102577 [Granulicella rosea]
MMADKSDTYMKYNLAEPAVFRNTFPAYAALGDSQIAKLVAQPVNQAQTPDPSFFQNSTYPLLTREAALSNQASTADAQTTAANAFCAKHPGTPAEYR